MSSSNRDWSCDEERVNSTYQDTKTHITIADVIILIAADTSLHTYENGDVSLCICGQEFRHP